MGYWKDNFPGSPAYFQRIRVARIGLGYCVVVGGLFFFFSPGANRWRRSFEEGVYAEADAAWKAKQRLKDISTLAGIPDAKRTEGIYSEEDRRANLDFTRPRYWEKNKLGKSQAAEDVTAPSNN